jgi:hypothetical protein
MHVADEDVNWDALEHAYGSASDIPGLLATARTDLRPGHEVESTWFKLWSALCHQGDIYSASYAAVPELVALAQLPQYQGHFDPLLLAACIELARLEGSDQPLPTGLLKPYQAAIGRGLVFAKNALRRPLDSESTLTYRACVAAFEGQVQAARELLSGDP